VCTVCSWHKARSAASEQGVLQRACPCATESVAARADMKEGQRNVVVVNGTYGWDGLDGADALAVPRPDGLKTGAQTRTELHLIKVLRGGKVWHK
jgi:hypothetical protein